MNSTTEGLIEIFFDLVRIDATAKNEKPVADYVKKYFRQLNLDVIEDEAGKIVGGSSGNIIIPVCNNSGIEPVALVAHMDTIKSTEGINPQINDGMITSDGSTILGADNRAGMAIILCLAETLIKNNIQHRPFEIIFTIGEETGLYGATHLDLNLISSKTAYILDSSADPGGYVFASPGAVEFEISLLGKPSHAAVNPAKGVNAIRMASELIGIYPLGQIDNDTTINIGTICGGEANNVVPPRVDMKGEIRSFNPGHLSHYSQLLEKELRKIAGRFGGDYRFKTKTAFPGFRLDRESKSILELMNAFRAVDLNPDPLRYRGGSDANVLNSRGLCAIDLGIGAKNPHATDEYIKICDMEKSYLTIYNLLTQNL